MENRNIKDGVRVRRNVCIYIPIEQARSLDVLIEAGATTSSVVSVALQRSLPSIKKQFDSGKNVPGLRVRKNTR